MKFSSKAKNLLLIKELKLQRSIVPDFYKFTVKEILNDKQNIISKIYKNLGSRIIIRSSFFLEDKKNFSMAGEFEGKSDIKNTKYEIKNGINFLINQYKAKSKKLNIIHNSEIIFQNYLYDSVLSGVVTNKCLKDGSNYYVINYDDTSNRTDTITSGGKKAYRVLNIYKKNSSGIRSIKFKKIIEAVKEVEKKILTPVDIEFALDKMNKVNFFQIRPISTIKNWKFYSENKFHSNLKNNQNKYLKIFRKNLFYGNKSIFGLMPDWNPAEIIGYHPNQLAYSIYKKIITDSSWAKARRIMGYEYVDRPLMYKFAGKPFIDTRLSFYSMIPLGLNRSNKLKLVNYWSQKLINEPYLHDKIEFNIVDGSFDANLENKINKDYYFFKKKEKKDYLEILKKFTVKQILSSEKQFSILDLKLKKLEDARSDLISLYKLKKLNSKDIKKFIRKIKKFGTEPFSIYARHAFIAKKFLSSIVLNKVISEKTYKILLNNIGTITNDFINLDKNKNKNKKNEKKFLKYFYHLRPGTYDININRYKNYISKYRLDNIDNFFSKEKKIYISNNKEILKINKFLKKNKLNITSKHLFQYFSNSIKMRENSKFIFTRSLSDLIEILKKKGEKTGFSKKDLSNLTVKELINIDKIEKKILKEKIAKYKTFSFLDERIKLPYLITTKDDFYIASNLLSKPNFISNKIIKSEILQIRNKENNVSSKIVLIENADPGFDWIFSKKINGLITKYGGVNSHMSIRCEELNIPAAIGVGEDYFNNIKNSSKIILNCKNEQILSLN